MRNATLKRDDQARLTEKESVVLFLIGRALRMLFQKLGQRQGRPTDRLRKVGAVRESVARLAALHFYLARS